MVFKYSAGEAARFKTSRRPQAPPETGADDAALERVAAQLREIEADMIEIRETLEANAAEGDEPDPGTLPPLTKSLLGSVDLHLRYEPPAG
jgi:hypothetical protein